MKRNLLIVTFIVVTVFLLLSCVRNINEAPSDAVQVENNNINISEIGIPILMYHHIVDDLTRYEGNEAVVSVLQFEEQMRFLAENNFTTLNASQLLQFLNGKTVPENTVVITFDDGYESNYIYAYPILKELELTAIIHIIPAVIPGEIGGDRPGIPKVNWDQMRRMVKSGFVDIQSHTFDSHYRVATNVEGDTEPKLVSPMWIESKNRVETHNEFISRIAQDLKQSEKIIEERLNNDVIAIAYPFGVHNDYVRQTLIEQTGIKLGFTVRSGYVFQGDDPLRLNRINVSPRWVLEDFIETVQR